MPKSLRRAPGISYLPNSFVLCPPLPALPPSILPSGARLAREPSTVPWPRIGCGERSPGLVAGAAGLDGVCPAVLAPSLPGLVCFWPGAEPGSFCTSLRAPDGVCCCAWGLGLDLDGREAQGRDGQGQRQECGGWLHCNVSRMSPGDRSKRRCGQLCAGPEQAPISRAYGLPPRPRCRPEDGIFRRESRSPARP